jgi:hypothetical protein
VLLIVASRNGRSCMRKFVVARASDRRSWTGAEFVGQSRVVFQANVFTPTCATAACHTAIGAQAGLVLDPGASWANLVNVTSSQNMLLTRVIPMNPDGSFLIHKLEGTQTVGGQMPANCPPLQQSTIQVIRLWIQNGALP